MNQSQTISGQVKNPFIILTNFLIYQKHIIRALYPGPRKKLQL